jgi:hypothetical protein
LETIADPDVVTVENGTTIDNYLSYRAYNVSVFSTPSAVSSTQLDIIVDFKIDSQYNVVLNPKKYAVVAIQRVMVNGTPQLVSSCTLCESKSHFSYYFVEKEINDPQASLPMFRSCRHVYPAISRLLQQSQHDGLNYNSLTFNNQVYSLLCNTLSEPDMLLVPGNWYCDDQITHTTKKGKMSLFFTESFAFILISNVKLSSGRHFLYCYDCRPRYNGCHHSREISVQKKNELGLIEDELFPENKEQIRKSLNRISKLKYPFDVGTDESLSTEILKRQFKGLEVWALEYGLDEFPRREILCCGIPASKRKAPTKSSNCVLFSSTGMYLLTKGLCWMYESLNMCAISAKQYTNTMEDLMVLSTLETTS